MITKRQIWYTFTKRINNDLAKNDAKSLWILTSRGKDLYEIRDASTGKNNLYGSQTWENGEKLVTISMLDKNTDWSGVQDDSKLWKFERNF